MDFDFGKAINSKNEISRKIYKVESTRFYGTFIHPKELIPVNIEFMFLMLKNETKYIHIVKRAMDKVGLEQRMKDNNFMVEDSRYGRFIGCQLENVPYL